MDQLVQGMNQKAADEMKARQQAIAEKFSLAPDGEAMVRQAQ